MPFKKGNKTNKYPCCSLSDFAELKKVSIRTLQSRQKNIIPLPEAKFIAYRGSHKVSTRMFLIADLKKWHDECELKIIGNRSRE
jgi:hypothetical protein